MGQKIINLKAVKSLLHKCLGTFLQRARQLHQLRNMQLNLNIFFKYKEIYPNLRKICSNPVMLCLKLLNFWVQYFLVTFTILITLDLLRKAPSTFNYFIMFSATIARSNFYQIHVGLKKFYSYPFNGDRLRNLRCILLMSSGAVSHFSKNSHMNAITQVRVKAKFISRKRANSILLIENELTPELSI